MGSTVCLAKSRVVWTWCARLNRTEVKLADRGPKSRLQRRAVCKATGVVFATIYMYICMYIYIHTSVRRRREIVTRVACLVGWCAKLQQGSPHTLARAYSIDLVQVLELSIESIQKYTNSVLQWSFDLHCPKARTTAAVQSSHRTGLPDTTDRAVGICVRHSVHPKSGSCSWPRTVAS